MHRRFRIGLTIGLIAALGLVGGPNQTSAQTAFSPVPYLTQALDLLQQRYYFRDQIDWPAIRAEALASINTDSPPAVVHAALASLIQRVGTQANDRHLQFFEPSEAEQLRSGNRSGFGFSFDVDAENVVWRVRPSSPAERAGLRQGDFIESINGLPPRDVTAPASLETLKLVVRRPGLRRLLTLEMTRSRYSLTAGTSPKGRRLSSKINYVQTFGILGDDADLSRYVTASHDLIRRLDSATTCGWILDERHNTGGNLTLLLGLEPLIGKQPFLGVRSYEKLTLYYAARNGQLVLGIVPLTRPYTTRPYLTKRPFQPMAILTSAFTASGGEASVLAFVNRADGVTRVFGEPSYGVMSYLEVRTLSDGAEIWLTVAGMTDVSGKTYIGRFQPDDLLPINWSSYGTAKDPLLIAAQTWLMSLPECQATLVNQMRTTIATGVITVYDVPAGKVELGILKNDAPVNVTARSKDGRWVEIRTDTYMGWIASEYLRR